MSLRPSVLGRTSIVAAIAGLSIVTIAGPVDAQIQTPAQPQPQPQAQPRPSQPDPRGSQPIPAHDPLQEVKLDGGLVYVDLRAGQGAEVLANSFVMMNYTAWIEGEGTLVDTNRNRMPWGKAIPSPDVIPGFNKGMMGMKVGGQRKIIIPPALAYGEKGTKRIPPNSTLIWVVDVLDVVQPPKFDVALATKTETGALWHELVQGSGEPFAEGSYGEAYISIWNGKGECVGSTRQSGRPQAVSSTDGRYWTPFLLGMRSGGQRVVELDNPQLTGNEAANDRWRLLLEIRNVQAPIAMTPHDVSKEVSIEGGVRYVDLSEGTTELQKHDIPVVHYNAFLTDGTLVDSTRRPGRDAVFVQSEMMPRGFVDAIKGMKVGGKRKLMVPAAYAYGEKGSPGLGVPANADLIWEVELIRGEQPLFLPVEEGEGEGTFRSLGGDPAQKED